MSDFRFITLGEASQLITGVDDVEMRKAMQIHLEAFAEFVEDESSKIRLYEGDVTLPYLAIKDDIVIVHGNLTVTGILEDCLEVNISLFLALGDVTVQNLFTFSQICVAGNVTVENAILADSTYDYSLHVGGILRARIIIEYHHTFYAQQGVRADFIYASHAALPRGPLKANLQDHGFVEEVLTKDELDLGKALERIVAGGAIVKHQGMYQ
jgi:hypothetical protein